MEWKQKHSCWFCRLYSAHYYLPKSFPTDSVKCFCKVKEGGVKVDILVLTIFPVIKNSKSEIFNMWLVSLDHVTLFEWMEWKEKTNLVGFCRLFSITAQCSSPSKVLADWRCQILLYGQRRWCYGWHLLTVPRSSTLTFWLVVML